jgi:hypothetical protein
MEAQIMSKMCMLCGATSDNAFMFGVGVGAAIADPKTLARLYSFVCSFHAQRVAELLRTRKPAELVPDTDRDENTLPPTDPSPD